MNYIITDIATAENYGFRRELHTCKESYMFLNEKEVMNSPALQGVSLQKRADELKGAVCSQDEALNFIR